MIRKKLFSKRNLKIVVALALAASLAVPVTSNLASVVVNADDEAVTSVVPKRLLDFNEGLKEYNADADLKLEIVATESQYVYKTEEEKDTTDRLEANGLLIMGNGSTAYFKDYTISNQPSTYVDSQRGTVLYMGKTVHVDAVVKTQSSVVKSSDGTEDTEAAAKLDADCPIPTGEDKTIQPAMTVRSELNFNNPVKDNADKCTVAMWIKIPTVEGVTNELAGEWHHVAVAIDGDNSAYYLDGAAKEDAAVVDGIKAWAASGDKLSIGGGTESAKAFASAFGITDANAEIMIDDIAFYTEVLTAEQVAAYVEDAKKEVKPVANKIKASDFKDISTLSGDLGYPGVTGKVSTEFSTTTGTVNGKAGQEIIEIPENKRASASTGAYIKNPFAGKNLDGATISFWTKQDKRSGKNSTGDENTPVISFIDTTKEIEHAKSNTKGEAWSMIGVMSQVGNTIFQEGFSDDGVSQSLKNNFFYTMSDDDAKKYDVKDWYYVTLVMNNYGLTIYINGVHYDNNKFDANGKSIAEGVRFLDGYFQRKCDDEDIKTKYNIYGGTNNQYATTLMSFLNYDDINLFLGYRPNTGRLNYAGNPTSFSGIRTFDVDLTAEQVAELYKDNTIYDDGSDLEPSPGTLLGDVNLDGKLNINDVTLVLRAALNIEQLSGQALTNADVNKDGKININDVTMTLQAALNIIQL